MCLTGIGHRDQCCELSDAGPRAEWPAPSHLVLVIEVVSPSTARQDRFAKRRRYQEAGIPCYWIVDGDAAQGEIWTPGNLFPKIAQDSLLWHPAGAGEPPQLELPELFRTD